MKGSFANLHPLGQAIILAIIEREGIWSLHKDDPGMQTKYGITEVRARKAGWTGTMRDLPLEWAKDFYAQEEWFDHNYAYIEHVENLVEDVCDFGVNAGHEYSIKLLQRSLNLCNRKGVDWDDLKPDGFLGLKTTGAVNSCIMRRGNAHLMKVVNLAQGRHYWDLTEGNMDFESFFNGWIANRVEV